MAFKAVTIKRNNNHRQLRMPEFAHKTKLQLYIRIELIFFSFSNEIFMFFAYNSGILIYWWPKSITARKKIYCVVHTDVLPHRKVCWLFSVIDRFESRPGYLQFWVLLWYFSIPPGLRWVSTSMMLVSLLRDPLEFVSQPIIWHCVDLIMKSSLINLWTRIFPPTMLKWESSWFKSG
jgi:hypothetical protein